MKCSLGFLYTHNSPMRSQRACRLLDSLLADLSSCRDLSWGRRIHAKAVRGCSESNLYVVTALIRMYAKCGSMPDARGVFDSMDRPDVVSWNFLLLGYADNGEALVVLDLFSRMKASRCVPNSVTYVAALKACTSLAVNGDKGDCLQRGKRIHGEIGWHLNEHVQNTLIHMYAKGGSMPEARRLFESIQGPGPVAWTALILGYAETGEGLVALDLFSRMKASGCAPTSVTYVAVIKACMSLAASGQRDECMERGRQIHSEIGCHSNHYVQNTLLDMYVKCRSVAEARRVFDSIQNPDIVSWSVLMLGYAENGEGLVALSLLTRLKERGLTPDSATYVAALKACTCLAVSGDGSGKEYALQRGREIHLQIGCCFDHYLQNTLVDMYAKCGSMVEARRVFDGIQNPDVVSWGILLLGYAENGEGFIALDLFAKLKARGFGMDHSTYIAALKSCTSLAVNGKKDDCLRRGRVMHSELGCQLDHLHVQNTLLDMYCKCSSMVEARRVFDGIQKPNVVSWNALLMGYAENGEELTALYLFPKMKVSECSPNYVTYMAVLKACASLAGKGDGRDYLEWGKELHSEIGNHLEQPVRNTLIDLYANCGSMADARCVFDSIQKPDVVSWSALMLGYAENGDGHAALELFSRMKASGCVPNSVTYIAAVKACGLTGALELGRQVHSEITQFTTYLLTCLVAFYAKCGSMADARRLFDSHPTSRDVSTWSALLSGYCSSDTAAAFELFEAMQDEGYRPDAVTFLCMLLCCSHAGLVDKATEYFEAMASKYRVAATVMHYNCMVDVLGRANQLNEAIALMRKMPVRPDTITWRMLLSACHKWKNAEIGRLAFHSLDKDSSAYVLMAQIYGSKGMCREQEMVQLEMRMKTMEECEPVA